MQHATCICWSCCSCLMLRPQIYLWSLSSLSGIRLLQLIKSSRQGFSHQTNPWCMHWSGKASLGLSHQNSLKKIQPFLACLKAKSLLWPSQGIYKVLIHQFSICQKRSMLHSMFKLVRVDLSPYLFSLDLLSTISLSRLVSFEVQSIFLQSVSACYN